MKKRSATIAIIFTMIFSFSFGYYAGTSSSRSSLPTRSVVTAIPLPTATPVSRAFSIQPFAGSKTTATKKPSPTATPRNRVVAASVSSVSSSKSSDSYYVINIKTKKFHKPSCASVKQMKESNKDYSYDSREKLISAGYDPCGRCHP